MYKNKEAGATNPLVVSNVLLAVLAIAFGSIAIWAYLNYKDQKYNTDAKIDVAVAAAKKTQSDDDDKKYAELQKAPYVQFVGPDELGRVTFNYPKTWSAYTHKVTGSTLESYLHPGVVPSVGSGAVYALRVNVINTPYEQTLSNYQSLVKKGDLKSSAVTVNGLSGIRLDGSFSKTVQGSMVIFKIRDKTLTVATDSTTFRSDFDNIILTSLTYNP